MQNVLKFKPGSMLLTAAMTLPLATGAWAAGAPVEETAGLEVITVTAQKVTEVLQKSAAAITASSGDTLIAAAPRTWGARLIVTF